MNELAYVFRSIIVDDCINALDIETSTGQISSNEDFYFSSSELIDDLFSQLLRFTTVILSSRSVPKLCDSFDQRLAAISLIDKNNDRPKQVSKYSAKSLAF